MIDIEKIIEKKGEKCWQTVGSFGDGTCEYLDIYNHCKNCPVYAYGGRELFQREVPDELIEEWTQNIKQSKEIESTNKSSIVVFRIADEWLGINTHIFQEAIVEKFVHFVPSRTNMLFHGVINVSGELLMCLSLARLINIEDVSNYIGKNVFKNLLIIFNQYSRFAFPVDEFYGIVTVMADDITSPPITVSKADMKITDSIIKVKDISVAIINEKKLFSLIDRKVVW